jgi:hypothetical protein
MQFQSPKNKIKTGNIINFLVLANPRLYLIFTNQHGYPVRVQLQTAILYLLSGVK